MKCEIKEICGDWALEISQYPDPKKPTIVFFNSRQNALNVKRIIEIDDSVPNAATVCDMQEVVYCKNCKHFMIDTFGVKRCCREFTMITVRENDFCSYGQKVMKNDR